MSDDIGEFSSEILHDQALTIARLRAKCERLEGENTQLSKLAEEYRLKIPTTAQAMVYMDLLQKHERLEAKCAEMRRALEYCQDFVMHKPYGTQFKLSVVEHAISTNCGKAIVEHLKEARWLLEHHWNALSTFELRDEWLRRRGQWLKGQP